MRLPQDFAFVETARGRNERIPVDALHFGVLGYAPADAVDWTSS